MAELHNRFNDIVVSGDTDIEEFLVTLNTALEEATTAAEAGENEAMREKLIDIAVGAIVLVKSIDRYAELEFHRQRRMFYIIGDLMMTGVEGDERGHREWMKDEGDEDSFDEAIRGYVDSTGVYAYKGRDFSLSPAALSDFEAQFPALVEKMNLDADLPVYAGVVPGRIGTRWEGRKKLGLVKELMNW